MPVTNSQGIVEHVLIWGDTIKDGGDNKVFIDWNVIGNKVDIVTMYSGAQNIDAVLGIQASTIDLLLTGICFETLLKIVA